MPHISKANKRPYRKLTDEMVTVSRYTAPGDLAFLVACLLNRFCGIGADFARMNAAIGVLDNVKDEFRRLRLHPYEDRKRKENGSAL